MLALSDRNQGRDVADFNTQFARGLSEEKRVKDFLISKGFKVFNSSRDENKFDDIDCFIGEVSVSIKAEHAALKYANRSVYFEIRQQLTETQEWVDEGWYHTGKAEKYLILQGTELMMIDTATLKEYIGLNGWDFVRPLGWRTVKRLGGTYRYMNAECGYISYKKIPVERRWFLES